MLVSRGPIFEVSAISEVDKYRLFRLLRRDGDSTTNLFRAPHKALRGVIPCSFLEPFARSWSHSMGFYRQKLTKSSKNDFRLRFEGPCVEGEHLEGVHLRILANLEIYVGVP